MHIQNIYTFCAQSALTLSLKSQRCDRQIRLSVHKYSL